MKTIKQFEQQTSISGALVRAVIRQCGGWDSFREMAQDVNNHGADGGFGGWFHYTETTAFYAHNRAMIAAYAATLAREIGDGGAVEMVQGFRCLGDDYTTDEIGETLYGTKRQHNTQVANALAWFALEEVCRAYVDAAEGE